MKHLSIGICEETEVDTELLIQHLKIAETVFDMTFDIHIYTTGKKLLQSYCPVFDILFLELPLPDINSHALLSHIRRQDSQVEIILLSSSSDFYRLGYEYHVRNYFLKPVWYRNIYHELKKLFAEGNLFRRPYLWVSTHKGSHKIYLHKLRYIETNNRQLSLHYGNEEISICGKLSDFETRLPAERFFRCNHSYIVNIDYIETIEKDLNRYRIGLVTGENVPLSRDKKRALEEILDID